MPETSKIKEFPDISNKLTAPTKKSLFERQRAEAEAKRQREEAETAAVYEDFVKSFDDEGVPASENFGGNGFGTSAVRPGAPRRHFAPSAPSKSGPGSLGPPPPSLARKRALDGSFPHQRDKNLFAFDDNSSAPTDAKAAFQTSDDEDDNTRSPAERAAPKPTLQLSSLPPGTSPAVIKALIPSNIVVDSVRILPPAAVPSGERKSLAAFITLAKDTPASDIDAAVNTLQNRYLGLGFNLSLSRHLSSAVLSSAGPSSLPTSSTSLPFGARPVQLRQSHPLNRAPPPSSIGRGFPPPSYNAAGQYGRGSMNQAPVQVVVAPPSDIKQLKLIHKTLEAVLTHGPEFEALLMSRPEVQQEAKWAWLWDARSPGGVWYRWRLWEILSGSNHASKNRRFGPGNPQHIFEGGAPWQPPEQNLRFEFTMSSEDFVSDSDYNSSDEDESGDEGPRKPTGLDGMTEVGTAEYLNPLQKAKLTHLLARLPTSTARLRKGDVARVTAYAISHAGRGSEEVVDMLIANVERPFAFTKAASSKKTAYDDGISDPEEGSRREGQEKEKDDPSSAKLIALYLISDLLSSSSTSGVSHAWRYRQLFEAALKSRRVFERLGLLEKELGWGRLRAEKWRRAVSQLLSLWEGWCVFSSKAQEEFMLGFTDSAEGKHEKKIQGAGSLGAKEKSKGKWKAVEDISEDMAMDADAEVHGFDGEPMEDDGDLDGEPMSEEDIDGEPMVEDDNSQGGDQIIEDTEPVEVGNGPVPEETDIKTPMEINVQAVQARRRRPKAVDMFADSDGE